MTLYADLDSLSFKFPGDNARMDVVVQFLSNQDVDKIEELAGMLLKH